MERRAVDPQINRFSRRNVLVAAGGALFLAACGQGAIPVDNVTTPRYVLPSPAPVVFPTAESTSVASPTRLALSINTPEATVTVEPSPTAVSTATPNGLPQAEGNRLIAEVANPWQQALWYPILSEPGLMEEAIATYDRAFGTNVLSREHVWRGDRLRNYGANTVGYCSGSSDSQQFEAEPHSRIVKALLARFHESSDYAVIKGQKQGYGDWGTDGLPWKMHAYNFDYLLSLLINKPFLGGGLTVVLNDSPFFAFRVERIVRTTQPIDSNRRLFIEDIMKLKAYDNLDSAGASKEVTLSYGLPIDAQGQIVLTTDRGSFMSNLKALAAWKVDPNIRTDTENTKGALDHNKIWQLED